MRAVVLALSPALLFGCPGPEEPDTGGDTAEVDTAGDTGDTAAPIDFGPGVAVDTCAPDDGPAAEIQLGLVDAYCDAPVGDGPFLRLVIWNHEAPLEPGTYQMTNSDDGMVWVDLDGDGVSDGDATGSVTLASWQPGAVVGRFVVHLSDGTVLEDEFDVPWCDTRPVCG